MVLIILTMNSLSSSTCPRSLNVESYHLPKLLTGVCTTEGITSPSIYKLLKVYKLLHQFPLIDRYSSTFAKFNFHPSTHFRLSFNLANSQIHGAVVVSVILSSISSTQTGRVHVHQSHAKVQSHVVCL